MDAPALRLSIALEHTDPPPCAPIVCPWFDRCRDEKLACAAFSRYVKEGISHRAPGEVPTREYYAQLFWNYAGGSMVATRSKYPRKLHGEAAVERS